MVPVHVLEGLSMLSKQKLRTVIADESRVGETDDINHVIKVSSSHSSISSS